MENIKELDVIIEKIANKEIKLEDGERAVVSNYNYTMRYLNSEHLVIDDIIWDKDLQEFLNTLRKINVDKIIITNTSTALMGLLHFLVGNECVIEGTATVKDKQGYSEEKYGLLLKIN